MANDDDPEKWDCPPHTKAKHDMLAKYLDAWYFIMSRWNGRVLVLDGFAGRGRYSDGSEGSPQIALRRLIEHRSFEDMKHREFVFLFVEAKRKNADSLRAELDELVASYGSAWPSNVKFAVEQEPFDKTAGDILAYLDEQKRQLAPTFAFVDPFGYSGLPMETLASLMAYPKTELFVNFMVGHVQRFITRDGQEKAMRDLFGIDVADVLDGWDGSNSRVEHLIDVYEQQLGERAGFDHVWSFRMKNDTGNISYVLFHCTRHRLGVKRMKAAMWAIDPGGGYTFSDRTAGLDVLFESKPDLAPLRAAILANFAGRVEVPVEEIEWFAILETAYRETHIRGVLTKLEKDDLIQVRREGKRGFAVDKTWITFV